MTMSENPKREEIPAIPDTPENIAWAIMQGPPKAEWDYLKQEREPEADDEE